MAKTGTLGVGYHSLAVSLPEELLEVLACPKCHGRIEPAEDQQSLRCPADRLRFPIVDGVPVMLLDEASPF